MKAERRHELQQNALAAKVMQMPNVWRIYAGRALVALAVVAVVAAVIVNRVTTSARNASEARDFLARAMGSVTAMRSRMPQSPDQPLDARFLSDIQRTYDEGKAQLEEVAARTNDEHMLGQSAVLRGDLNLALASLPALPGAATQPTVLNPKPGRDEAYALASGAYREVLEKYSTQPLNVAAARFGLGTIAENRGDFTAAAEQYKAIANDTTASQAFRLVAQQKLNLLPQLQVPPLIVDKEVPPLVPATTGPSATTTTAQATSASAASAPATTHAAK